MIAAKVDYGDPPCRYRLDAGRKVDDGQVSIIIVEEGRHKSLVHEAFDMYREYDLAHTIWNKYYSL